MKSHRKIEPEGFNSKPKPPEMEKVNVDVDKIPDSLQPKFRHKIIVKYRSIKNSIKDRVHRMFSKQTENAIRKNIPDNTLWGKIVFGLLDSVPLPQMHELWKAVQKEIPDAPFHEKMKLYWDKIDGVRTVASIAVSVLTAYFLAS